MKTKNYKVEHYDRNEWHWYSRIRGSIGYRAIDIYIESRKWSITHMWMPATITYDIELLKKYMSKEEAISLASMLLAASDVAFEMDTTNAPLGPTEV